VAKPWATEVRGWFEAGQWLKVWGLDKYFTPAQANAILPVIKAIKRPSPELNAVVGKFYDGSMIECVEWENEMIGEQEMHEGLSLRFAGWSPRHLPLAVSHGTPQFLSRALPLLVTIRLTTYTLTPINTAAAPMP